MRRKILWLVGTGVMALSLVLSGCGPAETTPTMPTSPTTPTGPATPTSPATEKPQQEAVKPAVEVPQYGGVLKLLGSDVTSVSAAVVAGSIGVDFTNESLWGGDWAKGPAGGYGTNETDWASEWYDIWELKAGRIAESWKWTVDEAKNEGTIVYQIRQGIHWALDPKSEASRLVNGRELTADDVVFTLTSSITDTQNTIYRANPELRVAKITKTGPWEVTIQLPISGLANGILRFGNAINIMPPEVAQKYGNMSNWKNSVGTGPLILTEYTPGSVQIFLRNNNYWQKDPVGPGKGNQLPYIDGLQRIIIPDKSTQHAALRTGKVDQIGGSTTGLGPDDARIMRQTAPQLLNAAREPAAPAGTPLTTSMRVDKAPFNDVRVRRALNMAIDYQTINQSLYGGTGSFPTWPFHKARGYEALWISMDDPDMPASVKELFTYNPEKAKALLKEAGYPDGFKTSIITTSDYVDYYSIYKDMWAKVGVELTIDVKDPAVKTNIINNGTYDALINVSKPPTAIFYVGNALQGTVGNANNNGSFISDPFIDEALVKIRKTVITTGMNEAMKEMRELMKYVLDQAYVVQSFRAPVYNFWWPWLKNYSGEVSIGYGDIDTWVQYVWIDQALKKSMGH